MKRKIKNKQVDAIICSDLHLTEQTPVCRLDDYIKAQKTKLTFISDLQQKYECPVLCAGDVFDHWKPSPWLISFALKYLPDELIAIPGQHDLPQHNLDLIEKSGFYALMQGKKLKLKFPDYDNFKFDLHSLPFGTEIPKNGATKSFRMDKEIPIILMLHQLTWQKEPWPGAEPSGNAKRLLKANPDFDLIITGDNHQAFTEEYEGRLLINPGSMLRSTAGQQDFRPRVYLWSAENNTAEIAYLPAETGVVSRQHLEIKEERKDRLDAFINLIQSEEFEIGVSFEENIARALEAGSINQAVKSKILEAMGQ